MSTPDTTQYPIVCQASVGGIYGVRRMGLVSCIARGTSDVNKAAVGYLQQCEDVAFWNCNLAGGRDAPSPDDWCIRSDSSNRVWFVDSYLAGGTRKPAIRGDHMDNWVTWSTPSARGTERELTLLQPDWGDLDPGVDNDGAFDAFGTSLRLFNRWVTGNNSGLGTAPLWGPVTGPLFSQAVYLSGGLDIRSESESWFGPATLTTRQAAAGAGEIWELDALGDGDSPNTFNYADPVDPLIPPWPTVDSALAGPIGSDPFVD
jgi:hypothetical protein